MEIKNIPFDNSTFEILDSENEKIIFISKFIFKIAKNNNIDFSTLLNEEIDDLYFRIISNEEFTKIKVLRPQKKPFQNQTEKLNKLLKELSEKNKTGFVAIINKISLYELVEFRYKTESGGVHTDKLKFGYRVFLEFKRIVLNLKTEIKQTFELPENAPIKKVIEKGNNLNLKIAMLENMDVLKWLENNIPNKTNRAEIIAKLIGGSPITIEDYLNGKNPIKNDVKQNAIDFINEKKYNSI